MPSITYWNRVEPSMRSNDISKSLAARVRDPLWMLARQWQFGEFHGEDAGSPAWIEIKTSSLPMAAWRVPGKTWQTIDPAIPLEKAVQSESFTFNLSLSVELGQVIEAMLTAAGFTAALVTDFRDAYPIENPTPSDEQSGDPEFFRFKSVAAGRALNGEELYRTARASLPNLPDRPPNLPSGVAAVLEDYVEWVNDVLGDLAIPEPPAWIPERLEYGVEVITAAPEEENSRLYFSDPGRDAEFDWDTFDLLTATDETAPRVIVEEMTETILPANVRFNGMPNARWWDFENATIDFGAIEPDRRELSKLVVMDFMLIHSNDWFVIPLEQKIGTVLRVDSLIVKDVFGTLTLVPAVEESGWTIFSSSGGGRGFVLPPSAGETAQYSAAIEDVRFIRDEMANMVWGVEHTIEGGLGQPLDGYERTGRRNAAPPVVPSTPDPTVPLEYILQTTVPENWIPFLPVAIDPLSGAVALERAAMLRPGTLDPIRPVGRILNPALPTNTPYRIAEEEVSRTGTRIQRVIGRSRGTRGGTFLWIGRRKGAGRGEGSSGLRYDLAQPNTAP